MSRSCVLELQRALVRELLSPRFLESLPDRLEPPLDSIDVRRFALASQLTHGKRMAKIMGVMPNTCTLLQPVFNDIVRRFTVNHPQTTLKTYHNALQFYAFLRRLWRSEMLLYPFLPDLAHCELVNAVPRSKPLDDTDMIRSGVTSANIQALWLRRSPAVRLHVSSYDIGPLLAEGIAALDHVRPGPAYYFFVPDESGRSRLLKVNEEVFTLVRTAMQWEWLSLSPQDGNVLEMLLALHRAGVLLLRVTDPPS